MRINEAIVRWLENAGVDAAFGDARKTVASGIIALQPSRKIKSVVTRNAQATSFAGVPYTFDLLDRVGFAGMQLPALRYVTQAGGRLAPEQRSRHGTRLRPSAVVAAGRRPCRRLPNAPCAASVPRKRRSMVRAS